MPSKTYKLSLQSQEEAVLTKHVSYFLCPFLSGRTEPLCFTTIVGSVKVSLSLSLTLNIILKYKCYLETYFFTYFEGWTSFTTTFRLNLLLTFNSHACCTHSTLTFILTLPAPARGGQYVAISIVRDHCGSVGVSRRKSQSVHLIISDPFKPKYKYCIRKR